MRVMINKMMNRTVGKGMDITIQGEPAQQVLGQHTVFSYAYWLGHGHHHPRGTSSTGT